MYRLIILGLIHKKPMHGYEIQQILHDSQVDLWTRIQTNSIYHALRQMEKEGLIEELRKETAGKRVRVVYTITEEGEREFNKLLEASIKQPTKNVPSELYASLSFIKDLAPKDAKENISEHIEELHTVISKWEEGLGVDKGFDDEFESSMYHLILQNGIEHMKVNMNLLKEVNKLITGRNE